MSAFSDTSGKVTDASFKEILLPNCGFQRPELLVGPQYGVDTAVISLGGGQALAVSSDPLSLIPSLGLQESAWLSVHLLANDMATTGFAPQYAQFVLNLPTSLTATDFQEYWHHIHRYCQQLGVAITGGHTGQIEGQNSTISGGGTMFLVAPEAEILTSRAAQAGDVLVVSKQTALVASSILAMSFPGTVRNKLGNDIYEQACANFYRTSSLADALAAAAFLPDRQELKAMHDVTEGGVMGAMAEMAGAAGCGLRIYGDQLPVDEAALQVCTLFGIDHRRCVGAGAMLMAVKPGKEHSLVEHLQAKGIPASIVGKLLPKQEGFTLLEGEQETPFWPGEKDPYWNAFFSALKAGMK
jgi:hydrogenase expression/formation protein HypE